MPFIRKVRKKIESLNASRELQASGSPSGDRLDATESRARTYPYSPLSRRTQTRVVVLQRGWTQSDQLQASLEVVDLADNPVYEAVSYAWGTPRFTDKRIYINGREIPIRYNLWAFLQSLSDNGRPLRLWIDALSICQDDAREKSHQVSLIGSIFNQAAHVRIWLGESEQNSQLLFESWPHMMSKEDKKVVWRDFIDREYFKRRWCIQEVLLAKEITVHCGGDEMPWEILQARVHYVQLKASEPPLHLLDGIAVEETPNNHLFFELLKLRKQNVRRLPILELMKIFEDARCTAPVDKVFAFLAIDRPLHNQHIIQPDYEMKLEQLFIRLLENRLESWRPGADQAEKVRDICRMFDLDSKQVLNIRAALLEERASTLWGKSSLSFEELGNTILALRTGTDARLVNNASSR